MFESICELAQASFLNWTMENKENTEIQKWISYKYLYLNDSLFDGQRFLQMTQNGSRY